MGGELGGVGGLDEDGEGGGGFHLTQEGLPPVGEAQDAEVGQSRRAVCGGQAQEGPAGDGAGGRGSTAWSWPG